MAGKKSDSENSNENGLHKSKRGKAAASTTATNKTKGTNQRKKATRQTASSTSVAGTTTSAAAAKDTPISSEGKARGKAEKQLSFVVNLCPDCFMPHLEGDDCPTKVRPDTPGKVSIKPPAFLLKSADKECDNYQEGRFMKQQWL